MANDSPVTLAVIIGAHGVTGEVRLKVFAEDLSVHRSFNGGALTLKSVRHGNNGAIGHRLLRLLHAGDHPGQRAKAAHAAHLRELAGMILSLIHI